MSSNRNKDRFYDSTRSKPDRVRRENQSLRVARMVLVHRKTRSLEEAVLPTDVADKIAKELGVSQRTVYRDWATLQHVYDALGSTLLDGG